MTTLGTFGKLLILAFMLFYLVSLSRMWYRAWFRPPSELYKLPRTIGAGALRPVRWLEKRPRTWLWLHRLSVTLGLLLALLAVAVLLLSLLGMLNRLAA